jgi:carbon-monoxide dehydrogenase large subunit
MTTADLNFSDSTFCEEEFEARARSFRSATGLGASVPRLEDARLVSGRGHFVDDIGMPNVAYGYVLRSPHAHARIVNIDKSAALAMPGVLIILTAEDARCERLGTLPRRQFPKSAGDDAGHVPPYPILADGKVRHVGDRVALIVAESVAVAKDAAERIVVEYQPLRSVGLSDALMGGAPKVWDDASTNLCVQLELGDRAAVENVFARADHVTKLSIRYPRASANAIEPRAALAYYDPVDGRCTLCTTTQAPYRVRESVAAVLGFPEINLRVIAPDVGGGFGMKGQVYPEEVLVVWAARKLERPVKWTADRSESLTSDMHGRDQITTAELALAADGHFLALRAATVINVGAYLGYSAGVAPAGASKSYSSVYALPLIRTVVRAAFTNTAPVGPYRGSGKPEASFTIERLVDQAAREMGIDPIAMRRRNLVPAAAMPYRTQGGHVYDSGDFERVLDRALALADRPGFAARRAMSEQRGFYRGFGLAMHCQQAGHGSERMEIRIDENGSATLNVGTVSTGQGHETMFAQMASDWLGVPLDRIRVSQGDTDRTLFGRGTFAQRSMLAGGSALRGAAQEIVEKGKRIAAQMLKAAESDIDFQSGIFHMKGTNRSATFAEVAKKSYVGGLPGQPGVGLCGAGIYAGPVSFPNGCMICEVEVDPDTGRIVVDRLTAVDDVGVAVNPMTLEGQLHGSIAQGLGEVLIEEVVYDSDTGQLLSGSFMDYCMPRATDMPQMVSEQESIPAKTNPLGVKGGAEAGNVGAPAAVINAVMDALAPLGVRDIPLPAKAEHVWRAIQDAAILNK